MLYHLVGMLVGNLLSLLHAGHADNAGGKAVSTFTNADADCVQVGPLLLATLVFAGGTQSATPAQS